MLVQVFWHHQMDFGQWYLVWLGWEKQKQGEKDNHQQEGYGMDLLHPQGGFKWSKEYGEEMEDKGSNDFYGTRKYNEHESYMSILSHKGEASQLL